MKIGFIGCGNMAKAILYGLLDRGIIAPQDIRLFDVWYPAIEEITNRYPVGLCENERAVVAECDIVILAVKPNVLGSVLDKINTALEESDTLLISIAAGKTTEYIRNALSHDNRIIRVMPNINALVGEAICAYTANRQVTKEDRELCENIFSAIGKVIYLEETYFPVFGVLGGCTPAFTYMYIDALARAGVKNGMKKETALMVAAQSVLGSAKMILESNEHPWELVDKVCSPGGTTIEGVASLKEDGFEAAVDRAVKKAVDKDKKL